MQAFIIKKISLYYDFSENMLENMILTHISLLLYYKYCICGVILVENILNKAEYLTQISACFRNLHKTNVDCTH